MGKTPYGTKIIGRQPSGLVITRVFPRAEGGPETDAYEFGGHLRYGENPGPGEAAAIFGHDTLMTTLQLLRMKKRRAFQAKLSRYVCRIWSLEIF